MSNFNWDEKDRETPITSLYEFQKLQPQQLALISDELVAPISSSLADSVAQVLSTSLDEVPHHVDEC